MRTVIQLKETNFGVWFSAVKGIRVISSHSPPLCTDYQDQNREDLESRHILQNRPHYQYLIISLSSQLIITRGHVPHGPALNRQGGRGGAYPTNNNASIPKKKGDKTLFCTCYHFGSHIRAPVGRWRGTLLRMPPPGQGASVHER